MILFPLAAASDRTPVLYRAGIAVSRHDLLREAAALAARLPEGRYVINDCVDRGWFVAALLAALAHGQETLFPSNRATRTIEKLAQQYPGLICLSDRGLGDRGLSAQDDPLLPLPHVTVNANLPGDTPPLVADFPVDQSIGLAFTSGSTGEPKRWRKTWGNLLTEAGLAGRALGLDRAAPVPVLGSIPAQHMYGFTATVMVPMVWGYPLVSEQPFFPQDIANALARLPGSALSGPAILVTTPVQLRALVREAVPLPPLRFILSSTAPLAADIASLAEKIYRVPVIEFYGSTETGAIASRRQAEGPDYTAFDGIEVFASPHGIEIRAAHLPAPVLLADEADVASPRSFTLRGRNAEVVKIGGKRNSLAELSACLCALPGVLDGVFFVPDTPDARLVAFVVAPGRRREDLLHELGERLDPVFLPRPLFLVDQLPRAATTKLPQAVLAALYDQLTVPIPATSSSHSVPSA